MNTSRALRLALFVPLMTVTLAGCQTTNPGPARRSLPDVPQRLMRPVPVPKTVAGQDARVALRRYDAALIEANSRLSASARWYQSVRRDYAR